jgi:hypothetical protein
MPASRSKKDRSKPKTIEVCPELNELDIGEAIASLEDYRERTPPGMGRRAAVLATRAKHAAAAKGGA